MREKSAKVAMYDYQTEAIKKMGNGKILCGGVGTGKSRTALGYFYTQYGGKLNRKDYTKMKDPPDLYIITTARKRDTKEWEGELIVFCMNTNPELSLYPKQKVVVDSWNNIKKYTNVKDAFFIFDEQRVVGSGAWVKAFLKIAKFNKWILLSATPGDTWSDYIPVFLANGFYKNRSAFLNEHAVFSRFSKFPKIEKYIGTKKLEYYRNELLVDMKCPRTTKRHYKDIYCEYDKIKYKRVVKDRWDIWNLKPIENPSQLCYCMRKVCYSDESRIKAVKNIVKEKKRVIIFYNYDYELNMLKATNYGKGYEVAQWNGHVHEEVPTGKKWVYLVQYAAGSEAWNCITTDTIIFYSQNYSYKVMEQASGRIDRVNTKYKDLYYYILKCRSGIDLAVTRALKEKKEFNVRKYTKNIFTRK